MKITSRPEESSEELALTDLDQSELELIAALLYNTKLGHKVSTWRDAAFSLMQKIEIAYGDDFIEKASADVEPRIVALDSMGTPYNIYDVNHFEIEV